MTMIVFFLRLDHKPNSVVDNHLSGIFVAKYLARVTKFTLAPGWVYHQHYSHNADKCSVQRRCL
jgi:hypothetical protein